MSVSAIEAAFEGFRVTRRRPGAVVLWALVWLAGLIVMMFAAVPFIAPHIEEIAAAQGEGTVLSAGAAEGVMNATLLFIPIALVLQGLLASAVYRAVLRPEEKAFGSLRLGRDEGRVLLVGLLTGGVSFALNLGAEQAIAWAASAGGMIASALVWLALTAILIALSVRLCLIAPLSFLRRKLAIREGWRASGRMFWPLLGLMVIVITLAILVVLLLIMIGWPMQAVTAGAAGTASAGAGLGAVLLLLLMPLGMAMVSTIVWAPFAAICRDLPEA